MQRSEPDPSAVHLPLRSPGNGGGRANHMHDGDTAVADDDGLGYMRRRIYSLGDIAEELQILFDQGNASPEKVERVLLSDLEIPNVWAEQLGLCDELDHWTATTTLPLSRTGTHHADKLILARAGSHALDPNSEDGSSGPELMLTLAKSMTKHGIRLGWMECAVIDGETDSPGSWTGIRAINDKPTANRRPNDRAVCRPSLLRPSWSLPEPDVRSGKPLHGFRESGMDWKHLVSWSSLPLSETPVVTSGPPADLSPRPPRLRRAKVV
ncbi:hypothetical protein BC832DRAFT_589985 [Gaertneriomyces semiglobifer]|nr:hypothetical protein BC832DRAFT_589985 [Gaertneriomyces semiglobifer]